MIWPNLKTFSIKFIPYQLLLLLLHVASVADVYSAVFIQYTIKSGEEVVFAAQCHWRVDSVWWDSGVALTRVKICPTMYVALDRVLVSLSHRNKLLTRQLTPVVHKKLRKAWRSVCTFRFAYGFQTPNIGAAVFWSNSTTLLNFSAEFRLNFFDV